MLVSEFVYKERQKNGNERKKSFLKKTDLIHYTILPIFCVYFPSKYEVGENTQISNFKSFISGVSTL